MMRKDLGWQEKIGDTCERFRDFLHHLGAFGARATHLGRGALMFDRWRHGWPVSEQPLFPEQLGPLRDGWIAAQPDEGDDAARLAETLAVRRASPPKPQETDRISQAALRDLIDRVIAAGAVPVIVIPPRARSYYFVPSPENARRAGAVIDLCAPHDFPELFALENRIDTSHLNPQGAEIFTRLLVERFLQMPPSPAR
jgi:hypothetical protein